MESQFQEASQFSGMQRRIAQHLLKKSQSPDCQNCRPYNGLVGRLGPRKGRTKLSSTAYAARLRGFWPGSGGGGDSGDDYSLVAVDDGSSVTVLAEAAIWSGGGVWGGPAVSEFNGFYTSTSVAATAPDIANPAQQDKTVANGLFAAVPVNGATVAIASAASGLFTNEGACYTYLQFDGVWTDAVCASIAEPGGLTNSVTPFDCTGKTNLTGVRCVAEELGELPELSGTIYIIGVKP